MSNKDGKTIGNILVGTLIASCTFTVLYLSEVPVVYKAHNKCVKVVPVGEGDCNNLPNRYEVVIVSPNWKK